MSKLSRQAASVPLNSSFVKSQQSAVKREPYFDLTGEMPIAEVGQTIPILFCKREGGIGGAWVVPTLVRTGLQNSTFYALFSHALVLSEGEITAPIADYDTDVFLGDVEFNSESFYDISTAVTYGSLPTSGFTYGENLTPQYALFTNTYYNQGPIQIGGQFYYHNTTAPLTETGSGTISFTSTTEFCTYLSVGVQLGRKTMQINYTKQVDYYTPSGTFIYGYESNYSDRIPFLSGWTYLVTKDGVEVDSGTTIFDFKTYFTGTPSDSGSVTITLSAPTYRPEEYTDVTTGTTQERYSNFSTVDQTFYQVTEYLQPPYVLPDKIVFDAVYRSGTSGDFSGLTIFGIEGRSRMSQLWEPGAGASLDDKSYINSIYNKQVTLFCSNGINVSNVLTGSIGPSNNIADLINYLALKYAESISVNTTDLQAVANFTNTNSLFFNGTILNSVNFKEWLETVAPYFLITPVNLESQISALPALPVTAGNALKTSSFTPAATFARSDIEEGSYSVDYVPVTERRPFEAIMLWRDQGTSSISQAKPYNATTKVRYASDTGDLPQEQYDMSEFCVTEAHATMAAKYILATRRHITHTVSFAVNLFSSYGLRPGSLIALELRRTTDDGSNRLETTYYLVDTISRSVSGSAQITAEHFPIEAGASLISTDIVSGSFTVTT